MPVVLNVYGSRDSRQVIVDGPRFTIGRRAPANLELADEGVSSLHATIHSEGNRIWILDEGSANGTYVNGQLVPPVGIALQDGFEISLGNETTIVVSLKEDMVEASPASPFEQLVEFSEPSAVPESTPHTSFPTSLIAGLIGVVLVLIAIVVFAAFALNRRASERLEASSNSVNSEPAQSSELGNSPLPEVSPHGSGSIEASNPGTGETLNGSESGMKHKPYLQMDAQAQLDFIEAQARHISLMMGNRPYAFNDEVLRYIKQYLDGYAKRVGNNSTRLWAEDPRFMFARAREQYAPHIIRAFNGRGVPPVVGLYLVVVETEYHNIQSENFAGAAGLFQFIGPTARAYGVDPAERTNVAKMAPAAAAYMADRIAEFGPDSMSVALAIAGYNRSPDSVRRDLADVLNSENRERSFWTLVANSNKLDHYFQGENIKYVPKFFAAAIVGETPWAFGIQMQPLSTYAE